MLMQTLQVFNLNGFQANAAMDLIWHFDGLVQDCSISSALALEIL